MLDFNILSLKNEERCEKGFNHTVDSWSPEQWTNAIGGEYGELCGYVKEINRKQSGCSVSKDYSDDEIVVSIGKELADIVLYCDLLATRFNLKLGDEVKKKFNETSEKIKSDILL